MAQEILNLAKIPGYLKKLNKYLPFKVIKVNKVKELSGGLVSYVYQATVKTAAGPKSVILKQVLREIKRQDSTTKLPLARIVGEARLIKRIGKLTDPSLVPEIFYFDKKNYVLVISDIRPGKRWLTSELDKNHLYAGLAGRFGKFFSQLHSRTYGIKEDLSGALRGPMTKYYLPVHLMWGARKHFSEFKVKTIFNMSRQAKPSLIWLDPIARNIFVGRTGFSLVDFEFCLRFDPAVDLGIFLAAWTIKTQAGNLQIQRQAKEFIRKFTLQYRKTWQFNVKFPASHLNGILKRSNDWLGCYLLSRVDGKHGSYVKDRQLENRVRELGKNLIKKKVILIK